MESLHMNDATRDLRNCQLSRASRPKPTNRVGDVWHSADSVLVPVGKVRRRYAPWACTLGDILTDTNV